MPVWSDDPKTEFLTSMLVLFIMYVVCPGVFYEWLKWRDRKKEREEE